MRLSNQSPSPTKPSSVSLISTQFSLWTQLREVQESITAPCRTVAASLSTTHVLFPTLYPAARGIFFFNNAKLIMMLRSTAVPGLGLEEGKINDPSGLPSPATSSAVAPTLLQLG